MNERIKVNVTSEIGDLEAVLVHTPGIEVESMTPETAQRALYSDILNLSVALDEYVQMRGVLEKLTNTFEVRDLLSDVLNLDHVRTSLIDKVCLKEGLEDIKETLHDLQYNELARVFIEGLPMKKNNLTRYLDVNRFTLDPLPNFFFTRDAASAIHGNVLVNKMANKVREREADIMEAIFTNHPNIDAATINPDRSSKPVLERRMEGGDILVARKDVLIIGLSTRTSSQGIDYILKKVACNSNIKHIIVQELPKSPESFIHLDMIFTFIDVNKCMVYKPVVESSRYLTIHIEVDNCKVVSISEGKNLSQLLKSLGFDLQFLSCGGNKHILNQEREQWHSGANFFALAPGKIIGYERNVYTIEELSNNGFEVIKAKDFISGKVDLDLYKKWVITIHGAELARGGGGCRCMTMPFKRKDVDF